MQDPTRTEKGEDARSLRAWIWILGASVVLAVGVHCSRLPPIPLVFRPPQTPIDLTSPHGAGLWQFLIQVRDAVPAGASYTVQAPSVDDEMNLYMLSLGLLFRQEALPSSYYGIATPDPGRRARFVLVYGAAGARVGRGRLVRKIEGGAVYERMAA